MERQGDVLTSIGTRHDYNLPRQVRDILNIELGFRREAFVDERE